MDELEVLPETVAVAAQAIVANAQRLGLTWTLRIATVNIVTSESRVDAVYDGDVEAIGMENITGEALATGLRVYVLMVPPGGNFIVGFVGDQGDLFANASTAGSLASATGASEVAIPAASWTVSGTAYEPIFMFLPGLIYQLTISGAILPAAFPGACIIRVRKGSASTSGTQLIYFEKDWATSGGLELLHIGWIKNATPTPVFTKLSLTIQRISAFTMALYGDGVRPMVLESRRDGSIAGQPGKAAIAIQV